MAMARDIRKKIEDANRIVVGKMQNAKPVLIDVRPAAEAIPRMRKRLILHSGPPIKWNRMCWPQKGSVIASIIYEGLAKTPKTAVKLVESGEIELSPCHHHNAVGSMGGAISASQWVYVVRNKDQGNLAYCNLYEGRGRTAAFGCYDEKVIEQLRWMEQILGPALQRAVREAKEIDLIPMVAQALTMGDECHNRSTAATLLFIDRLLPYLLKENNSAVPKILKFITGSHYNFFLTIWMAACKAIADSGHGVDYSTIVTAIARNGVEYGIRLSGLGSEWFTAPSSAINGVYYPGYGPKDATPDMGDSSIVETIGLGGLVNITAPTIVSFIGGSVENLKQFWMEMKEIVTSSNSNFLIPYMNFEGAPLGVDIRKVVQTGILPVINTGIAHKKPNMGLIGTGYSRPPIACFEKALTRFGEKYVQ